MRYLFLALFVLGCDHDALEERTEVKNGIKVQLLFTNDGCNVWRFDDGGHNRYYADCGNVSSSHQETRTTSNGKTTTTYQVTIPEDFPNARPKK